MKQDHYTKVGGYYYKGCGCGQRPENRVEIPENSVELFVNQPGLLVGPVSGQLYNIVPSTTAIDIRKEDEAELRKAGLGHNPIQGFKGVLTRVPANEQVTAIPEKQ